MHVVESMSKQRSTCVTERSLFKTKLDMHLPHLAYFLPYLYCLSLIVYNPSVPLGPFACKLCVLGDTSGRIIKPCCSRHLVSKLDTQGS